MKMLEIAMLGKTPVADASLFACIVANSRSK